MGILFNELESRWETFNECRDRSFMISKNLMSTKEVEEVRNNKQLTKMLAISYILLLKLITNDIRHWRDFLVFKLPNINTHCVNWIKWEQNLRRVAKYVEICCITYKCVFFFS